MTFVDNIFVSYNFVKLSRHAAGRNPRAIRSTLPQSWIDDYESWMTSCCTYNTNTANISSDPRVVNYTVCQSNYDDDCGFLNEQKCSTNTIQIKKNESSPADFQENIAWFLDDSPGESCATAGKAAYRWVTD